MRPWKQVVAVVLLPLLLAALAAPASAANTWSDTDPIVVVSTPAGHQVAVYANVGVWGTEHLASAQAARMTYTVQPVQAGSATGVLLNVLVTCDGLGSSYGTRVIVSSAPFGGGTWYGSVYGYCGQGMSVQFKLDSP